VSDRLVSTSILRQRLAELEEEVAHQRRMRAVDDPFFTHSAWLIAEFREAIRLAEIEYRPTMEVAKLTGWSAQTLRKAARAVLDGADPGEGWQTLLVKQETGGDYAFAVASVPVKRTGELQAAS